MLKNLHVRICVASIIGAIILLTVSESVHAQRFFRRRFVQQAAQPGVAQQAIPQQRTSQRFFPMQAPTAPAMSAPAMSAPASPVQPANAPSANAQSPGWYPRAIAPAEFRSEIRETPIELRPNRPLHFYGNTVRRIYYDESGNSGPLQRGTEVVPNNQTATRTIMNGRR